MLAWKPVGMSRWLRALRKKISLNGKQKPMKRESDIVSKVR